VREQEVDREVFSDSARLIANASIREFFARFCREVMRFSDDIDVEIEPFTLKMKNGDGFEITLSPLREIFLVSIGKDRSCDIRVSSIEDYLFALDLVLHHFLSVRGGAVRDNTY